MANRYEEIKKTIDELKEGIEDFISDYNLKSRSSETTYKRNLDSFYDDRLEILYMINKLKAKIREEFEFFPESMVDLLKIESEFKKLKHTEKKENVYRFRELSLTFLDKLQIAFSSADPMAVLVKETTYEDIKKTFVSAMKKISKNPANITALQVFCTEDRYLSAKDLAVYLNVTQKTATTMMDEVSNNMWMFFTYSRFGKETKMKAKPILKRLFEEVGQDAV